MSTDEPWNLRPADLPSDLAIDAWVAGDATPAQRAAVEGRAETDPAFRALLEARARGLDEVTRLRMEKRLATLRPAPPRNARPWVFGGALVALAAAAAVFVALRAPGTAGPGTAGPEVGSFAPPTDTVRARGGPVLRVFRRAAAGEASDEVLSGAIFRAGDRLRFRVGGVELDDYVLVVGVERDGQRFAYSPADGRAVRVADGLDADGTFAGAAQLDDSRGEEWAHLVVCPAPFTLAEISGGAPGEVRGPAGCATSPFRLVKP